MTSDCLAEFSTLVRIHLNSVVRYLIFLSQDPEEAKDIAQEIFLKAWQKFDPRKKSTFKAWIMTITRNFVIDRSRRRKPVVEYSCNYPDETSSNPPSNANLLEAGGDFCPEGLPAFAKLHPQYREIVYMRFVEQLSYQGISQITGKSEEALRKIVSRAVAAIRKEVSNGNLQQG
ncbi:MAG: RNA polymerase sigma factor [Candidatus Ozemobacteraceae bacterium]